MPTALVRRKAGYENSPCADEKARLRVISAAAQAKASRVTRAHCGAVLVARGSRRWSDASPGAATLAHLRARCQLELRGQELASLGACQRAAEGTQEIVAEALDVDETGARAKATIGETIVIYGQPRTNADGGAERDPRKRIDHAAEIAGPVLVGRFDVARCARIARLRSVGRTGIATVRQADLQAGGADEQERDAKGAAKRAAQGAGVGAIDRRVDRSARQSRRVHRRRGCPFRANWDKF